MSNQTNLKHVEEFQDFMGHKYHWTIVAFPIMALLLLSLLLFLPIVLWCDCSCDWKLLAYLLVSGALLLIASILLVKRFVPYWTRVAELEDKQKEKLMRLSEERLENARLSDKTKIGIEERKARSAMDEAIRDAEHKRKLEIMDKEYQTHVADVALDMVKAINQKKEGDNSVSITFEQLMAILNKIK